MQPDPNPQRMINVRKVQEPVLARQDLALARRRYAIRYETNTGERGFSYALLVIMLFQTVLLSCAIVSFGVLLLLNLNNVLYRPPAETYAATDVARTPPPNTPVSPAAPPEAVTPEAPTPSAMPGPDAGTAPTVAATETVNSPTPTLLPPPTLTPINNAPPQETDPAVIQGYANQVLPPLNNLASALESLRALAQNLNMNDPQWVANVNAQISSIQMNHEQLRSIQPPPEAQEVHNALLNTLNICRTAADTLNASIINNNPGNLSTVLPDIENCNAQFPTVANNLREWIRVRTGNS